MKKLFLIQLFVISFFHLFAVPKWNPEIEGLFEKLNQNLSNEGEIDIYNQLGKKLRKINPDTAFFYANLANELSINHNYKKGAGESYWTLGVLAKYKGDNDKAIEQYKKSLAFKKELGDHIGIANVCYSLGTVLRNLSNNKASRQYFDQGLDALKKKPDPSVEGKILLGIANIYRNEEKLDSAFVFIDKGFEKRKDANDTRGMAFVLKEKGLLYFQFERYGKADSILNKSLEVFKRLKDTMSMAAVSIDLGSNFYRIKEYEKAKHYYNQALEFGKQNRQYQVFALSGLGAIHKELGETEKAKIVYNQVLDSARKFKDVNLEAKTLFNLGQLHLNKLEAYEISINYFNQSLEILDTLEVIDQKLKVLINLSRSYFKMGDYKRAGIIMQGYHDTLSRHIQKEDQAQNYVDSLETKENEKNIIGYENQIAQLKYEQTISSLRSLAAILGLSIVLCIAIIFVVRYNHRRLTAEQKTKELKNDLKQQKLETVYAHLEGKQNERNRIADDLHGSLGMKLSTIATYFGFLKSKLDLAEQEVKTSYSKAEKLLNNVTEDVRRISHGIKEVVLEKFGLVAQLEELRDNLNGAGQIQVALNPYGIEDRLSADLETSLYRITEDIVNNTLRHAKASNLNISLSQFKDRLSLMVEDDGIGFNLEEVKAHGKGMGLMNIEAQVNKLDGTVDFDSTVGQGTIVNINIPLENEVA